QKRMSCILRKATVKVDFGDSAVSFTRKEIKMPSILPNTDRGLLTADNCALALIDHQPQMVFGVGSGIDRQSLVNNVLMLAKGAKLYGIPTILSTVETESFSGSMWPQLLDVFPQQKPIE